MIKIRKTKKEDKEAFVQLSLALTKFNKKQHDKHYKNFQEVLETRKQRVEERFDKLDKSSHLAVFMALIDNKPAGYIRAFTYDNKLRCGCLDELYLTPEARGQGIGKKLIDTATDWMTEKKVVRVTVSVYSWNASAKKFYEEEGFTEYATSYEKTIPKKK